MLLQAASAFLNHWVCINESKFTLLFRVCDNITSWFATVQALDTIQRRYQIEIPSVSV